MNFAKRSYQKELMDGDNVPVSDMFATLQELNKINTYLGGHGTTIKGIAFFVDNEADNRKPLSVAEIGCGGGDNLSVIRQYLAKIEQAHTLTGIDINPDCIKYGQENAPKNITWICDDYRAAKWPRNSETHAHTKPDIIFSSLFCHHFTDEELIEQLQWLKENSRLGFFINDLHRHPMAYYAISLLTRLFSKSRLVKNDGPLSVMRAFKKQEWVNLLAAAGIRGYTIKWQWAFRYLICVSNEQ